MRTNKLFIGALAVLFSGLASCSSEEPAGGNGDNGNGSKDGYKYMAVIISNTGMGDKGRADNNDLFEEGVQNECAFTAKDVQFLFYDENGNPFPLAASNIPGEVVSNKVTPEEISDPMHGPGNEPVQKAMIVLGKAVGDGYVGKTPSLALCLIHANDRLSNFENQSMNTVLNKIANYPDGGYSESTAFLMTNSVYFDENKNLVRAVDLTKPGTGKTNDNGKFYPTPDEANQDPAVFYIERVVAKVRVTGLKEYEAQVRNSDGKLTRSYVVDDKDTKLKVELTGWRLRNTATRTSAFKKIENKDYFTNWNDPDRHRCYWAISETGSTLGNTDYNIYPPQTEQDKEEWQKGWKTNWTGTTNNGVVTDPNNNEIINVAYCFENTTHATEDMTMSDRAPQTTAIVVRATVKKETIENSGTYEPVDLIRWAGAYYTLDNFKTIVANNYNSSAAGTTSVSKDNIELRQKTGTNYYQAYVKISDATSIAQSNFDNLLWWQDGITSYYANIEHSIGSTAEKKLFGVVRNHIYHYEFDGVIGLGIPGNEPDQPEETESFLSAQIYCLNWRVVNNKVTLE